MPEELLLDEIIFDDAERIRQNLDPEGIRELALSIEAIGLLNPIIVNRQRRLLAGRRRFEAFKILGRESIPINWFEDLDVIQQKIVELDENRKRKQLDWIEEAKATDEIHKLLTERNRYHRLEDTAKAMGVALGVVSEDLTLARSVDNPRITTFTSKKAALQAVKRERELDLVKELARRRGSSPIAEVTGDFPHHAFGRGTLYNADAFDIVSSLPDNSIDLIVTDPPWGVNLENSSQWVTKWLASYTDGEAIFALFSRLAPELYRVMKPGAHIYLFFAIQDISWWIDVLCNAGFGVRPRPLIWYKGAPSITDTYTAFMPTYEALLWGWKIAEGSAKRFLSRPTPEAFYVPRPPNPNHENAKPIDLITSFIEPSSEVNEIVLDPFAGGGSILTAAALVGRRFIGSEIDEINYLKACTLIATTEA